jgi:hypothetical protein
LRIDSQLNKTIQNYAKKIFQDIGPLILAFDAWVGFVDSHQDGGNVNWERTSKYSAETQERHNIHDGKAYCFNQQKSMNNIGLYK